MFWYLKRLPVIAFVYFPLKKESEEAWVQNLKQLEYFLDHNGKVLQKLVRKNFRRWKHMVSKTRAMYLKLF